MRILVTCAACRRKLKVRDESLGKTLKCPSCEEKFVARAAEEGYADTPPAKSRRDEQIRGGKPLPSRKAQPARDDEDEDDYDRERRRGGRSGREAAGSNKGLIIGLVAGGVLLLAGVVVGAVLMFGKKDKAADGGGTKEVADTGPIPAADWKEFAPTNGRYKVLLPGTPVLQPAIQAPGTSNYTQYGLDLAKPPDRFIFTITHFDVTAAALREAPFEVRCVADRDRMVEKLKGKVVGERNLQGAGFRGKEYQIQGLGGFLFIERIYLADGKPHQRLFRVVVTGKPLEPGKGVAARFLDSFRIDAAAAGPVVQNPPVNPNPFVPPPRRNPLPSNFIIAHGLPTKYMVLNPAGTVMASADQQMLKLWDPFTKDHKPLASFTFLKDPVNALAFSADGKQLAVGRGGTVELRDGRTGKEMATVPLQFREPGVSRSGLSRCLAFAPNRKELAVGLILPEGGAPQGNVYLWDAAAGKEVRRFKAHDKAVWAVAYSPDGSLLATAGGDNLVKLWDTTTWAERAVLRGHTKDAHALAFSRDGSRLASAGSDATVIVWDVAAGKEKGRLTGHKGAVLSVAYSPNGNLLATGAADSLRLWDAQTFAERWLLRHPRSARVEAVAFHPDGVNLFSTYSGMIQRWELPKLLGP